MIHGNNGDFEIAQKQKYSTEPFLKRPEESGNKCIEAQLKSRRPKAKAQEGSKDSKQPISKKADEVTEKPGISTVSKNRWRDPVR